jgi:putative ABC transport system substrate-binding protein
MVADFHAKRALPCVKRRFRREPFRPIKRRFDPVQLRTDARASMRRREFLIGLGSAAAWPNEVIAQRRDAMRRVGILTGAAGAVSDARVRILVQSLGELGWFEGRNARFEIRHGGGEQEKLREYAAELVALEPHVLVANGGTATRHLLQATRKFPIVFSFVPDPVGSGFVHSMSRPGGNATGFTQFEYGISGKWLELLKEISPNVNRVAVIRDPTGPAGVGQYAVIQAMAASKGVETRPISASDPAELERDIGSFASASNGGMIVTSSTSALVHRALIIKLAAQHKLPTVYAQREFVAAGGLISYGANFTALLQNTAGYVDRILKGEKPADLPVQGPTRFEIVINTKTAAALGLEFPTSVLVTAEDATQ